MVVDFKNFDWEITKEHLRGVEKDELLEVMGEELDKDIFNTVVRKAYQRTVKNYDNIVLGW